MSNGAQYPSLLMIIRHGEKPGDPSNDKDGGPNLSVLGSARAAALPSLFTPDPTATPPVPNMQQLTCDLTVGLETPVGAMGRFAGAYSYPPKDSSSKLTAGQPRFLTPNFLFATQPGTGQNASCRPVETITPLAQALQFYSGSPVLTINTNFTNDPKDKVNGLPGLVSEITGNPDTYGGKVILICWHHGTIPDLTEDFKVPASQLPFTQWPATIFDLVFCITWNNSGQPNLVVEFQKLLYGDTASLEAKLTPPNPS